MGRRKSDELVTVSQIARTWGKSRQKDTSQRVTDIMVKDGLLTWLDNLNHKKAKLVNMTEKGKEAVFAILDKKQEVQAESGAEVH
ncbi:hypothetical protein OH492_09640 [Vibrio chagasii]|nr:hypothetical protein [Vibrio chagasii]